MGQNYGWQVFAKSSLFQISLNKGSPYTWTTITLAFKELKLSFTFKVGHGDISLFYDKWLDHNPCKSLDYALISDTQLRVSDALVQGIWQWQNIATQIPSHIKHKLLSLMLDEHANDVIVWGHMSSRIFFP